MSATTSRITVLIMRFLNWASVVGAAEKVFISSAGVATEAADRSCCSGACIVVVDLRLDLTDTGERGVPACLQLGCNQTIGGIGGIVLTEGTVCRIARRFKVRNRISRTWSRVLACRASTSTAAATATGSTTSSSISLIASSTRSPPKAIQRESSLSSHPRVQL